MVFKKKGKSSFSDRSYTRGGERTPSRDDRAGARSAPRSFSKKPFGASRGRESGFQLYDVVCARCGKRTQVPFKPTGEKPVLCRECFSSDTRRDSRETANPSSSELREINEKLDKILRHFEIE